MDVIAPGTRPAASLRGNWWEDYRLSLYGPHSKVVEPKANTNHFLGVEKMYDVSRRYEISDPQNIAQDLRYWPTPDAYLCVQKESEDSALAVRVLGPQTVDFGILQKWMKTCVSEHQETCSLSELANVPGLQLLNIHTKTIQDVQDRVPYVALSYVWGTGDAQNREDGFPATVGDAITVTKRLGFDYLWIDRYCIPQTVDRAQERQDQIRRMAEIYGNAELTIIAAAGDAPEYGLPGVSTTPRAPQPQAKIGKYTLVSTLNTPRMLIQTTSWSSCAWTYQEGLCSRRRLLFTDEQVFFECEQMSCREIIDYAWSLEDYNIFRDADDVSVHSLRDQNITDVSNHIILYTQRKLTNDDDALNGLLGVLEVCQSGVKPVFHFWGLPVADTLLLDRGTSQDVFLASLQWEPNKLGRRRQGFPTWSWTAWDTQASWRMLLYHQDYYISTALRVSIQLKDGSFPPFEETFERYIKHNSYDQLSDFLQIDGWMIKLNAKILKSVKDRELFCLHVWPAEAPNVQQDLQAVAPITLTEPMNEMSEETWRAEPRQLVGVIMNNYAGKGLDHL